MNFQTHRSTDVSSNKQRGAVLFIGVSYYNNWYLSRALRKLGWKADVLTYAGEGADFYLHGYDFRLIDYIKWQKNSENRLFKYLLTLLKKFVQKDKADNNFPEWKQIHPMVKPLKFFTKLLLKPTIVRKKTFLNYLFTYDIGFFNNSTFETLVIKSLLESEESEPLKSLLWLLLKSMREKDLKELDPFFDVLDHYDILHFTGVNNLRYLYFFDPHLFGSMPIGWDIELLKRLGKKIIYSNTGCLDGVSQSSFRTWGPESVCDICVWRNKPEVCSDERNLEWGKLRNDLNDYQITLGGNRKDYNDDPRVHEVPEFYCLDPKVWHPDLDVPSKYKLPHTESTVKIFHAVGNFKLRSDEDNKNIKSTHIHMATVERLKAEGYDAELVFFSDVPNRELRFYQVQADIFVDMLTFGFFGATAREGMMLGKPVVCFLRPSWLESMRREIPEYVDELPVISATPETIYEVLKDLIEDKYKREEIGRRSREFAVKWHSAEAGAKRLDRIYTGLLRNES